MSLNRNPIAYLSNDINLHKTQVAFYRFLLRIFHQQGNSVNPNLVKLKYLYKANGGGDTDNPLDMIDYLGKQENLQPRAAKDKFKEIMRYVEIQRAFNKVRTLPERAEQLNQAILEDQNAEENSYIPLKELMLRINKQEQEQALDTLAANLPKIITKIQRDPGREFTNQAIAYINDFYAPENQQKKDPLHYDHAQQYVDALRSNNLTKFLGFTEYVFNKYIRLRKPPVFEPGPFDAGELMDLYVLELSKTDIKREELKKIGLNLALLKSLPGEQAILIQRAIDILGAACAREATSSESLSGWNIKTPEDLKTYFDTRKETNESLSMLLDYAEPTENEKNDYVTKNMYRLEILLHGATSQKFINYLLTAVNIDEIDKIIDEVFPKERAAQFRQEVYHLQIVNAELIKRIHLERPWQAQIEARRNQLRRELPQDYEAYRKWRVEDEKSKQYMDRIDKPKPAPNTSIEMQQIMDQGYKNKDDKFKNEILPGLQRIADEIAREKVLAEIPADEKARINDNVNRHLIKNIQRLIETVDWGARIRGKTRTINGEEKLLPPSVDRIYGLCLQANDPNINLDDLYAQMVAQGVKASQSFSFFRSKHTQNFLNDLSYSARTKVPAQPKAK